MAGHTSPKAVAPDLSPTVEEHVGSPSGADQRVHKRFELDLDGGLSRDGTEFIPCRIHDFCLGGMLVVPSGYSGGEVLLAGKSVARGDKLIVRCVAQVGGEHHDHKVRGRAASVSSRGVGVSFDADNPDEVWRITQLVRKLREARQEERADERSSRATTSPMGVEQAVNAGRLLEEARRHIQSFLASGVEASFQDAEDRLFALANDASSDADRTAFHDAIEELNGFKVSVESAFFGTVDRELNGLGQPASQRGSPMTEEGETELSLMDTGNFDDWLTTKNIISATQPFLKAPQFDLEQRLSHLVNAAIHEENNPIGLTAMCLTFHDSIQNLGASRACRHAVLQGFDKTVIQNLETLYDDLNNMLVEGGVLQTVDRIPNVASTSGDAEPTGAKPSTKSDVAAESERAASNVSDDSPTREPELGPRNDTPGQTASTTLPPLRLGNAFRAAGTLIALQSEADPAASAEIGQFLERPDVTFSTRLPDTVTAEQQRELLESMSILQRSPRFAQSSESGPLDLKQKLHTTWRSAGLDFAGEHRTMIEIVSNLVDAILDDPFLSEEVKTRVRRLAVPILKVAIQDNGFFDDQMHPARQILDCLGRMDLESAEELAKVVDPVVNNIIETYENDATVFANALAPLKSAVSRQRKTFQQNLERVVTEREEQHAFIKARQKDADTSDGSKPKESLGKGDAIDAATSGVWSRWLAEAQRCKPGDVLSMEGKDGHRQKLTLAWISEDKGTFVLVDPHGNKAMSLTAQELAMQIKRGTAVVADTAEMALTDRGTYRMLRSLHSQLSRNASHDRLTDVLTVHGRQGRSPAKTYPRMDKRGQGHLRPGGPPRKQGDVADRSGTRHADQAWHRGGGGHSRNGAHRPRHLPHAALASQPALPKRES